MEEHLKKIKFLPKSSSCLVVEESFKESSIKLRHKSVFTSLSHSVPFWVEVHREVLFLVI